MTIANNIHFNIESYQVRLLDWFDKNGRHNLPWQKNFDPYHVWISEIMLQQTQVKTVIPYFKRFIKQFPTIQSLACASEDILMTFWAGLGYYSRARNLQKAAKMILVQHNSNIPSDYDSLIALPGIGRSTANAILSISFNKKAPILDGNVKRVFSRLFAINEDLSRKSAEVKLWEIADCLISKERTQSYTQAQMDLGALCCTRTRPSCQTCPHQTICLAKMRNKQSDYPMRKLKKAKPCRNKIYYIYRYQNKIFLYKDSNVKLWCGLYTLPDINFKIGNYKFFLVKNQKYSFTHYDLFYDIEVYYLNKLEFDKLMPGGLIRQDNVTEKWVSLDELDKYPTPTLIRNALTLLREVK